MVTSEGGARYDRTLAKWLYRVRWELFAHLTARRMPREAIARGLLRAWIRELNREAFGRKHFKRGESLYGLAVIAPQTRGDLHVHALLAGTNELDPATARDLWDRKDSRGRPRRRAEITLYDPSLGGVAYVCHHLGVTGDRAALEIFGAWPH